MIVQIMQKRLNEVVEKFGFTKNLTDVSSYGKGHINDTFCLTFKSENGMCEKVILQRINKEVFKKPEEVMENIVKVTEHVCKKVEEAGGDPMREVLQVIPALDGRPYCVDSSGDYWRAYEFISDVFACDRVENPEQFYQCGWLIGKFQSMLADYPAETLYETIEGFHDTRKRFEAFKEAVNEDKAGRSAGVRKEIQFVLDREEIVDCFAALFERGEIPLRVTHNDTKMNNILLDNSTGKAFCIVDLDTVMPGFSMNDFGDAIRSAASTAAEDERNLSKVSCDMELFEACVRGFIKGCDGKLTEKEIEMLPMGAKLMTFECGMRFLADYLNGDTYFKVDRESHNLDRCRTQFKLVEDMERKWYTMKRIIEKYSYQEER